MFTDDDISTDPNEKDNNPKTDLSGIKDDRTLDPDEAQAEQEGKDDGKPDLSEDINV
ncbi:hypothetical protein D3C79_875390 [compost metagenome]